MATLSAAITGSLAQAQSLAPLGYWQYNGAGTVSGTVASSGTNVTGVMTVGGTGAPVYTTSGMVGSGVEFNYATQPTSTATSKYLDLNVAFGGTAAPSGGYALGNNFSISTWYYKASSPPGNRAFLFEGATTFDMSLGESNSNTSVLTTYVNSTSAINFGANSMPTGTWQHVVQTFSTASSTTTLVTYINGVARGTTSASSTSFGDSGIHLAAARDGAAGNRALNGTLDETALWSKTLSAEEVLDAYNRGLAGVYLTNSNAVRGYLAAGTDNAWLTGANWGGTAPGVTADDASSNGDVAVLGNYSFTGGLGIDMAAASGNLALGAISFNSLAGSGTLSIGNSSATNGTLTLNGGQIDGVANVILSNEGLSDLTITNVQGGDSGQLMGLRLGGATNVIRPAAGRTLTVHSAISERSAGSGLTVNGGGTVVLVGGNTYTGTTTVSAGTLVIGSGGALGTTAGGTTVAANAALAIQGGIAVGSEPLSIAGAGISSGGALRNLSGNNSFGGAITQTAASRINSDAGLLTLTGRIAGGFDLTFGGSGDTLVTDTIATGAQNVTKDGTGTLTLSGGNTYTGGTAVNAGTLAVSGSAALGSGTITTGGGSTVSFIAAAGTTYTVGGLAGEGNVLAAGGTLAVGGSGASTNYSGNLTADVLEKQGAGTLGLYGSNTIGATSVAAGTLFVGSSAALGAGPVTLAGGLLRVGRGITLANDILLAGGASEVTLDGGLAVGYLLVGGGGGGAARDSGGGGGGGGVEAGVTVVGAGASRLVAVGAGGAGAVGPDAGGTAFGQTGGNSTFGNLSALGGGGGGGYGIAGRSGATGGGGGRASAGGAGTPGEGFAGGSGSGSTNSDGGGGGGGAGGAGGNAVTGVAAGSGGVGLASDITGTQLYYGGGGGGTGHRTNSTVISGGGGLGGGGAGSAAFGFANNGTNGLGGGGGAARSDTNSATASNSGGAGGSGTVILRYLGLPAATGGSISAGTGSAAGYTIHTFTDVASSAFEVDPVNVTFAGAMSGSGGFTWSSGGTLTLSGTSTFTGGAVAAAGRMQVDGSLASGVSVSAGAQVGGTGSIGGTLSGGGLVGPGNSPGITTASAVDPSGGLDFAFEFTGTGSPDYANAAASVNDVLRLTGATPFTSSLIPGNAIDIYFSGDIFQGDTFRGGFYVDQGGDFPASLANATFNYWVGGDGTGTETTYNGQGFFSLAAYDPALTVTRSTVPSAATFAGGGLVNGSVTQFVVVPEPATAVLGLFGSLAAGLLATFVRTRRPADRSGAA